ncbi:MAG: Flp pilus assembly protein CpaB [Planctomycetia bacterium]|nr:Flp pilus assembly protein CpaB [Planctomycetia bacterium]
MTWKTWASLCLALALGTAMSILVKDAFFGERPEVEDMTADSAITEPLLVANGFLPAGTELTALNVRLTRTPEADLPRDGIFSFNGVPGRIITRDLVDGEPISLYDLDTNDEAPSESAAFIPPGYVVVPIEIATVTKEKGSRNYLKTTKLDRIIKPGDLVDVVVLREDDSVSRQSGRLRLISEPVVEGVSVYAVSDESVFSVDGAQRISTVSTLMSSEQLDAVKKSAEHGKLKLIAHNGDAEQIELPQEASFDFSSANSVPNATAQPYADRTLTESNVVDSQSYPFEINSNFMISPDAVQNAEENGERSAEKNLRASDSDDFTLYNGVFRAPVDDSAHVTMEPTGYQTPYRSGQLSAPLVTQDVEEARVAVYDDLPKIPENDAIESGFLNMEPSESKQVKWGAVEQSEEIVGELSVADPDWLSVGSFRARVPLGLSREGYSQVAQELAASSESDHSQLNLLLEPELTLESETPAEPPDAVVEATQNATATLPPELDVVSQESITPVTSAVNATTDQSVEKVKPAESKPFKYHSPFVTVKSKSRR